jgi:CDP-paratose 2-epimerase
LKPVLVTGGAGFIGSNLADRLAREGHSVLIYDALAREGVERNLRWLQSRHPKKISVAIADVRDSDALTDAVQDASAVFHLAAQVAVTTSMVEPVADFDVNVRATLTLLEALRSRKERVPLLSPAPTRSTATSATWSSRWKATATTRTDPEVLARGVGETRPARLPHALRLLQGRRRPVRAGLRPQLRHPTAVLRMSCIYGPRQMGTEDQGWVAHFLIRALDGDPISIFGDGCQVATSSTSATRWTPTWRRGSTSTGSAAGASTWRRTGQRGQPAAADRHMEATIGRRVDLEFSDWRPGDQRYFVADSRRARAELGLKPARPWREGVAALAAWLQAERAPAAAPIAVGAA